ncbi:DUF4091 domain-containing protein [Pyxidicoccus trucidator]|uniref:DUF4091 domain-containing protein n=1 Tax=Pyxidicoccus trucidator TaxID=2709662 RepID=UPI0013DA553D|nr:DUF4091 domain-containing protein [Pyxidicoccus trucidator]
MLSAFRSFVRLLVLLAVPAFAAEPTVWGEGAMVKVRPDAEPRTQAEVHLTAARNEFVSFQVALHGGASGLRGVRASLPGLEGPASIGGTDVTLYRQDFLTTTRRSVPEAQLGRWPDALVPDTDEVAGEARRAFPFDVTPGEARAIWVDVHVPDVSPPGDYVGTVAVEADGGFRAQVAVRLTVVDAELPSTPSLATAFLLWPPHVCRAHFGREDCTPAELEPLLTRYQLMALEHRITLSSLFPRSPWPPDWKAFEATWGPYLDGSVESRLPGARMTSIQYVGPPTAEGLADFAAHLRARGWLERAYDYVGDEPPYGTPFAEVRSRAELARQAAPGLRTLVTTNARELKRHELEGLIDLAVPLVNHMDGAEGPFKGDQRTAYADFLKRPGADLWLYQSCMSHGCAYGTNAPENKPGVGWPSYMVDRSAAKARAMEWVTFLAGGTGELYYQTVGMLTSAWTDQFRFNGNGDGTLFYPGTPARIGGSTDVPVASLRLKLIRLGVQDFEWLKAVSDAGDPDFARRVARELIPAASRVSDDGAAFEAARLKLIQRYLELTGGTEEDSDVAGPPPESRPELPPPEEAPVAAGVDSEAAAKGGCSTGGGPTALAGMLGLLGVAFRSSRRARVPVRARRGR